MIVPFGIGPALVAGIILRMRGHPRWWLLGIGSALGGLMLVAARLLSLVLFGVALLRLRVLRLAAGERDRRGADSGAGSGAWCAADLVDRGHRPASHYLDRRLRSRDRSPPQVIATQDRRAAARLDLNAWR